MNRFIVTSRINRKTREGIVQARIIVFPFHEALAGVIATGGYNEGLSTQGPSKYAVKIYPSHTGFRFISGSVLARPNESGERILRRLDSIDAFDSAAIQTLLRLLCEEWCDIFPNIERVENLFLLKSEMAGARGFVRTFAELSGSGLKNEILALTGQFRLTSEDLNGFSIVDGRERRLPLVRVGQ